MDASRRVVAARLYEAGREHDGAEADRVDRLRNLEPASAELIGVLIRATGARRILELGTSNGYSTIWLADAAEATGGHVDRVELRTEDAAATLAGSADSAWQFVFLDAERPAYSGYVRDLLRVLAPGGLLAVDNVRSHEHELVEFTALIEAESALTQTVVPVGAGLRLAVLGSAG
jgi:predicted O-methyltransferase YrrM